MAFGKPLAQADRGSLYGTVDSKVTKLHSSSSEPCYLSSPLRPRLGGI